MEDKAFKALYEFIDEAVRNRKYAENTAFGQKAALRLFEAELNSEEAASLQLFESRFDHIYDAVGRKQNGKYTAASLDTYRKRVRKVLSDYKLYGQSTATMLKWNPSRRSVSPRAAKKQVVKNLAHQSTAQHHKEEEDIHISGMQPASPMHKVSFVLRSDFTFVCELPVDLSQSEAERIKNVINSYALPE